MAGGQPVGQVAGLLHGPGVGGNDHKILRALSEIHLETLREQEVPDQIVNRSVGEET